MKRFWRWMADTDRDVRREERERAAQIVEAEAKQAELDRESSVHVDWLLSIAQRIRED